MIWDNDVSGCRFVSGCWSESYHINCLDFVLVYHKVATGIILDLFIIFFATNLQYLLFSFTGLIGATSSSVTEEVSTKFSSKFKVPLVSYSSTASGLSDGTKHPYFMRTISPDGPLMDVSIIEGQANIVCF